MQRYDIVVPKPDQRDPEKTYWKNVGTLVEFEPTEQKPERGFILELHMFPTTTFKVFKQKPKPAPGGAGGGGQTAHNPHLPNPDEGIDFPPPPDTSGEDIPY